MLKFNRWFRRNPPFLQVYPGDSFLVVAYLTNHFQIALPCKNKN